MGVWMNAKYGSGSDVYVELEMWEDSSIGDGHVTVERAAPTEPCRPHKRANTLPSACRQTRGPTLTLMGHAALIGCLSVFAFVLVQVSQMLDKNAAVASAVQCVRVSHGIYMVMVMAVVVKVLYMHVYNNMIPKGGMKKKMKQRRKWYALQSV